VAFTREKLVGFISKGNHEDLVTLRDLARSRDNQAGN